MLAAAWLCVGSAMAAVELVPGGEVRIDGRPAVLADIVVPHSSALGPVDGFRVGEARGSDRWGRQRVRLVDEAGRSVAARWVEDGLAAVAPDADGEGVLELLGLEAGAREARRGIWGDRRWRVQPAEQVRGSVGDLVVTQGHVVAVGWGGDRLYLNFGDDRRTDFTARVERADVRALARAGVALEELAGREVRLRGWLFYLGGPMIELSGPAQIEVLP